MIDLDGLHRLFRMSHIVAGFAGLALFWIPVFTRKGSRWHVASGRVFAWCAYFVGGTGVVASAWGLVHPTSFFGATALQDLDEQQVRLVIEELRFVLSITGFLGLAVITGITMGTRIMRIGDHERLRTPMLLTLVTAVLLWSAGLATYGIGSLIAAYSGWHFVAAAGANHYWLCVILGWIGVYGSIGDLKTLGAPAPGAAARQVMHMQCMIGTGAGFYAAFFLFGASRLFALPGSWLVAAVMPLIVGAVATTWAIRHYRHSP